MAKDEKVKASEGGQSSGGSSGSSSGSVAKAGSSGSSGGKIGKVSSGFGGSVSKGGSSSKAGSKVTSPKSGGATKSSAKSFKGGGGSSSAALNTRASAGGGSGVAARPTLGTGVDPTKWGNAADNPQLDNSLWEKGLDLPYDYDDRNLHYFEPDKNSNQSFLARATDWNVNRSEWSLGQYWDSTKKQYDSELDRREDNNRWMQDAQIYYQWAVDNGQEDLANRWKEAYDNARYNADFGFYLDSPDSWDSMLTSQKQEMAQAAYDAATTDADKQKWQKTLDDLSMTTLTGSALTEARLKKAQEQADAAETEADAKRWSDAVKQLDKQLKEEQAQEKKENSFLGKAKNAAGNLWDSFTGLFSGEKDEEADLQMQYNNAFQRYDLSGDPEDKARMDAIAEQLKAGGYRVPGEEAENGSGVLGNFFDRPDFIKPGSEEDLANKAAAQEAAKNASGSNSLPDQMAAQKAEAWDQRENLLGDLNEAVDRYWKSQDSLADSDAAREQMNDLATQIIDINKSLGYEAYEGLPKFLQVGDVYDRAAKGRAGTILGGIGSALAGVHSLTNATQEEAELRDRENKAFQRYDLSGDEKDREAWEAAKAELDQYLEEHPNDLSTTGIGNAADYLLDVAKANQDEAEQSWANVTYDMSGFEEMLANAGLTFGDVIMDVGGNRILNGFGTFMMYTSAAGSEALAQMDKENSSPDAIALAGFKGALSAYLSTKMLGGISEYGESLIGNEVKEMISRASPEVQNTLNVLINTEGFEEGMEDILNYVGDILLELDPDAALNMGEVGMDTVIGYIVGVLTEGLSSGVEYNAEKKQNLAREAVEFYQSGMSWQEAEQIGKESTKDQAVMKYDPKTANESQNQNMATSQNAALEGQKQNVAPAPAQQYNADDIVNEVNSWSNDETNANMATSQNAAIEAQDANPKPAPQGETQAQQDVIDILMNPAGENGNISNSQARQILGNPELLNAFEELTGTTPETGSNSDARNSVKEAGAQYVADWENAQEARGRARNSMEIDDIIDEVNGWSPGGNNAQNQALAQGQMAALDAQGSNPAPAPVPQDASGMLLGEEQDNTQSNIDNAVDSGYNRDNNNAEGVTSDVAAGSAGPDQSGVSGVRETGGTGFEGRGGPDGAPVDSGIVLLSDQAKATLNERGVPVVDLQDQSADKAAFSSALDAAREADQAHGWAVTPKSIEDLDQPGMKVMMAANGSAGVVVAPDGDIEAVFANKSAGAPKGTTKSTIPQAIANGGTKLDCYGKGLVKLYSQYGFVPVARVEFNPEYANPGWDESKGRPDIYFMMYVGDDADTVVQKHGQYNTITDEQLAALPVMDYDAAYVYRDSLLAQQNNQQSNRGEPDAAGMLLGEEAETSNNAQETPAGINSQAEETNSNTDVLNAQETAENTNADTGNANSGANTQQDGTGTRRTVTDNARTNDSTDADFDALVAKNGAIEAGENPARDINVPKKDTAGNKVGEGLRTIMEAEATPESRLGNLKAAVINGNFGHIPVTNDTRSKNAASKIAKDGWKKSVGDFLGAVNSGKSDPDTIALGAHLLNEAGNAPGATGRDYVELAMAYNEAMTRAGQGLAAGRILKTLTPEGKLYGFEKTVEKINKDIRQKNEKRAPTKQKPEVKLNEKLVEDFLNAKTDAERDAVHDKMVKDVAQQVPNTLRDKFTALRYLNMLGNLKTQVRNVVGNVGMSAVQKTKNELVSVLEGIAETASGGKYERQYKGFYGTDLFRAAKADFGSDEMLQKAAKGEAKYSDVGKQAMAEIQDAKDPFSNRWAVGKFLNRYSKITSAAMEYGDLVFVRANYADALAGYLNAHNISSAQWEAMVNDPGRAADVDKARNYAIRQAQEATFRDTNAVSKFVSTMDKDFPKLAKAITQGVIPFRKTPANVLVRMEEYSPLGLVNTAVNGVKAARGEASAADVIDSMAKTMTGTALAALGFFLRSKGWARTKDKDEKEEALAKLRGSQDYSIEFTLPNGERKSFTLDWLTPASGSFFMGSELFDIIDEGGITPANAMTVLSSFTNPMLEMSMLSGVNDALSNLSDFNGDNSAMAQFVLNSAWSYLTQGISNTLAGQAEQFNEAYRQTYYTDSDNPFFPTSVQKKIAKLGNKTPGVDYHAADYIDAWGRKQKNDENMGVRAFNVFANPGYVSDMDKKSTEVDDLLADLYQFGKDQTERDDFPDVVPKTPSRSTTVNGEKLTPEEYDLYATTKGREALDAITEFSKSDTFKNMDKFAQAETISDIYSYSAFLAASRIAEARGETYYDDKYSPLIRGVDENGDETYKATVKRGDIPEYIAFKNAYDSAMSSKDYDAVDALLDSSSKLPASARDGAMDRADKMGTLMDLKDAGLSSASVYYQFQDDMKKIYEGEKRAAPKSSDYIRAAGSGKYSAQDADAIMNYETTASEKTVARYQDQVRYNLEMAGMGGSYSEVWHMVQSVADGDMTKDQLKSYVERNLPIEYRQAIRDVASNYAEDRHVAGKTVSGIYHAAREAGATPKEALEFYNMIDTNYNGYYTKKEFDAACRQMFGTGETGRQVRAALQDYVGK